ncbi:MAG TPA: HAMP domain-containing sensor histidine kinase [Chryseolinea sp.]|nr:HAMP domain-containing sensor histidine kinase [Chryseolinea sp.]HPH47804.1 HAMP domain-containing sensor histidine kinase [Chryseolinea sp.]HPM31362.1 HAMP domain-containing sensor histidine kinase [Chryseolinea sp.]
MKKNWNLLSNIGIVDSMPYEEVRKVRLLNQTSVLIIAILLVFVVINIIFPRPTLASIEFVFALFFMLDIYLHHKKKYLFASILFFINTYVFTFLVSFIFSTTRSLEYMFLVLSIFPLAIFRNKVLIYLPAFLCWLLFIIAKYYFVTNADFVSYLNGTMLFVLLFSIVKYLKDEHDGYRKIVEAQNLQLQKLNEDKNELIGVVSHDLRSPLKRIKGLLLLLTQEPDRLSADQLEIIVRAKDVAKQNIDLVGRILDIQSIEKNEKINLEKINILDVLNPIVKSFEEQAANKRITLKQSSPNGNLIAQANEDCAKQVFENLISNSLKFSYPESTVYITARSTSNHVYISIKDEGQGLDEEDQKNLFKKFQKLSAQPTSGEQSSGLGLAIVKKYVDAMNGTIECKSKKSKGAEFIVQLPIAE